MFKPKDNSVHIPNMKIFSIQCEYNPLDKEQAPLFCVTITTSRCIDDMNEYTKIDHKGFKFEKIDHDHLKISITPLEQMDEVDKLFANVRSKLNRNSIITLRDSSEIEQAYKSHIRQHSSYEAKSKGRHHEEREHQGGQLSF